MRVTNSMITSNSLNNINTNKLLMSIYENQQSTEKKISRPSDDPVIAIRALKYRSTLNEVDQYLKKNIPDAQSWIETTEGALSNISDMFADIYQYCNQGSTDSFTTTNRQSIINSIDKLKDGIYSEGNVDFAGRYVFTGYKTDSTLTFPNNTDNLTYTINQEFTGEDFEEFNAIINKVDANTITGVTTGTNVNTVHVLKMAYTDLCDGADDITLSIGGTDVTITPWDADTDPYAVDNTSTTAAVNYDAKTGQLIFNDAAYQMYIESDNIEVTYKKDTFEKGEAKPEHYFNCVAEDTTTGKTINYNDAGVSQDIYYNINFGQEIKVNTQANESIDIYIGRHLQDMINSLSSLQDAEDKVSKIETMINSGTYSDADVENLENMLEEANKELDYAKDNVSTIFSNSLTKMKEYQEKVDLALADLGSRDERLELVEGRLSAQRANVKELQSKNEDVELEEAVINLAQAQTVYNASLSAAAKIVQQSLIDFL